MKKILTTKMDEKIVICSIVSKNYLAHVRTLVNSFLEYNPNGLAFVLLVDEIEDKFDPKKENFTLIKLEDLEIENPESFCFKYNILELNTGVKAKLLKFLFEKYQLKKLAYFDPDILFTNSLENLWKLLDDKSIILTPHILEPIIDEKHPSDFDILRSGSYNLGFIGLSNTEITKKFLNWWIPRLMDYGYSDIKRGLFTDQKWMDLVPTIFDEVYVIKHPGYNIAYWNMMQRDIEIKNKKIYSNGKPAYFIHFSGFSPDNIENVSKHQNRFILKNLEKLRKLFELYRDLLVENDYLTVKNWKCIFDYFDNGIKIPNESRKLYSESLSRGNKFGNPFIVNSKKSFFKFLNEGIDEKTPIISRLWYKIYNEREDVQEKFPDVLQSDREKFCNWAKLSLKKEYNFDEKLLKNDNSNRSNKSERLNGINIAGYFKGQFGVAESARRYAHSLDKVNIPFVINNIDSGFHQNTDKTFKEFSSENPYPINLIVVNADQSDVFFNTMNENYFKNKYNIGVWAWETENFPEEFLTSLKYFDEIWTLSKFVANAISKVSSIPVIPITCPIQIDEDNLVSDKEKFGIDESNFMFLFSFDFASVFERKNPMAIIEAFKSKFSEDDNVLLMIKCINSNKFIDAFEKLKKSVNWKNIRIITENLDKNEYHKLVATCDCYVSLHSSEGFGLTMQEAMFAGKPVIATGYSGNMDFMNINNSLLVKYQLIELQKDFAAYKKGDVWAKPNTQHAGELMRGVYENKKDAMLIGEQAKEDIKKFMSFEITGKEIKRRIEHIKKQF